MRDKRHTTSHSLSGGFLLMTVDASCSDQCHKVLESMGKVTLLQESARGCMHHCAGGGDTYRAGLRLGGGVIYPIYMAFFTGQTKSIMREVTPCCWGVQSQSHLNMRKTCLPSLHVCLSRPALSFGFLRVILLPTLSSFLFLLPTPYHPSKWCSFLFVCLSLSLSFSNPSRCMHQPIIEK